MCWFLMYWKRALHSQASDFKTVVLIPYKKAFDLEKNLDKFIQCTSLFIYLDNKKHKYKCKE